MKRAFEDALMEQVAANITADIPDAMVEAQARISSWTTSRCSWPSRASQYDQYLKMTGMDESSCWPTPRSPLKRQVRMDLAMAAIIKAENIGSHR